MTKIVWDWKSQFDPNEQEEVFDCQIAEFLLSYGASVVSLETVLKRNKVTTLEELAAKQREKFSNLSQLYDLFQNVEMPLVEVLWQMETNGISLDSKCLKQVGEELDEEISKTLTQLRQASSEKLNWNSPKQVGTFLAEEVKVPLGKTKTGQYLTNENELTKYAAEFPIINQLLTYRELTKLRSTYIEALTDKVAADGRVHTNYTQVLVATGRISSNNPNLQNIPVSSDYGQKIKACFEAGQGKVLVSLDYSQQELRILAHLTQEEKLISAFKLGRDVHSFTASELFNVPYDQVTKDQRRVAKTINFGIIYGMSAHGMSTQLNIPIEEAHKFITTFYDKYPKIKSFFGEYIETAKKLGFAETLLGRRRSVFEYPGQKFVSNAMKRVLMNYPIQGAAADLMRLAMVRIHDEILCKNGSCALLLQIHDDLVFEMDDHKQIIKDLSKKISDIMCQVYPLSVPVEVETKIGHKWGQWSEGKSTEAQVIAQKGS